MLHPSYVELMNAINQNAETDGEDVVSSRYSVVIAAAKRARQIIENAGSDVEGYRGMKPLSVAVKELLSGDVKILPTDEFDFDLDDMIIPDDVESMSDIAYELDEDEESEDYADYEEGFEESEEEFEEAEDEAEEEAVEEEE